ncbi:2-enoate reductase, partial [Bacteroidota bacterium]
MKLFEPGQIGKLSIKNRIAMAPMGIVGLSEFDGRLSQRGIDYYVARAKGGTGLIITGYFRTQRLFEQPEDMPFVRMGMVDHKMYITRLSEFAGAIHDHGAKVCIQLTAGVGRVASPEYLSDGETVAPSPLPCYWDPSRIARELTVEEIEQLVQSFEFGASVLRDSGIDAVELHGHEGYLFDQFMTPLWNKRTDKYGGDLNGRLRFSTEVIEAIKRGAGPDFPIIYRIGLKHNLPGGREVEEGLEIVQK